MGKNTKTKKEILNDFQTQKLAEILMLEIELELAQSNVIALISKNQEPLRNQIEVNIVKIKIALQRENKIMEIIKNKLKQED